MRKPKSTRYWQLDVAPYLQLFWEASTRLETLIIDLLYKSFPYLLFWLWIAMTKYERNARLMRVWVGLYTLGDTWFFRLQGIVKSTVFGVFEDLKFKISEGYKQNWSCPDSALLAVSAKLRQPTGQSQDNFNFACSPLKF